MTMANPRRPGAASSSRKEPIPECPPGAPQTAILVLAERLGRSQAHWDGTPDHDALATEIAALERAIAEQPAENLTEAAVQLMLGRALIERWQEGLIEDEGELRRMLGSLIGSALAVLRSGPIASLAPFGAQHYLKPGE